MQMQPFLHGALLYMSLQTSMPHEPAKLREQMAMICACKNASSQVSEEEARKLVK